MKTFVFIVSNTNNKDKIFCKVFQLFWTAFHLKKFIQSKFLKVQSPFRIFFKKKYMLVQHNIHRKMILLSYKNVECGNLLLLLTVLQLLTKYVNKPRYSVR